MNKDNNIYKQLILNVAYAKFPYIRKRNYSLSYYLDMFLYMDNDAVRWESLKEFKKYKPKKEGKENNKNTHYKSIQNEFNRWCKYDIFIEAHNKFLNKYYFKLKPHLLKIGIKLFIDTSSIWNKYGIECLGVNPELRKKNITKIADLVDEDGDIISIVNMVVNKKYDCINGYSFIKKTFNHDVNIIQTLFDNICVNLDKRKNVKCCGDNAFKTNEIIMYNNKKVHIITTKRKRSEKQSNKMIKKLKHNIDIIKIKMDHLDNNSKRYLNYSIKILSIKNKIEELKEKPIIYYTDDELEILKKRHVVENNYCNLKKSERISIRKDHNIKNFMSFIYIVELKRITNKYYDKIIELNLI